MFYKKISSVLLFLFRRNGNQFFYTCFPYSRPVLIRIAIYLHGRLNMIIIRFFPSTCNSTYPSVIEGVFYIALSVCITQSAFTVSFTHAWPAFPFYIWLHNLWILCYTNTTKVRHDWNSFYACAFLQHY